MTEKKYPSDKQDKFMLRMPEGMREQIRLSAEHYGRSMNAEIVARLRESFDSEKQLEEVSKASATLDQKLAVVRREIGLMEQAKTEAQEFIRELREMGPPGKMEKSDD